MPVERFDCQPQSTRGEASSSLVNEQHVGGDGQRQGNGCGLAKVQPKEGNGVRSVLLTIAWRGQSIVLATTCGETSQPMVAAARPSGTLPIHETRYKSSGLKTVIPESESICGSAVASRFTPRRSPVARFKESLVSKPCVRCSSAAGAKSAFSTASTDKSPERRSATS